MKRRIPLLLRGSGSPGGRWIAYSRTDSTPFRIQVQPFPPTGAEYDVRQDGETWPVWSSSGGELFSRLNLTQQQSIEIRGMDIEAEGRFSFGIRPRFRCRARWCFRTVATAPELRDDEDVEDSEPKVESNVDPVACVPERKEYEEVRHKKERRERDQPDAVDPRSQHAIRRYDAQRQHGLPGRPVTGLFGPRLGDNQRIPHHFEALAPSPARTTLKIPSGRSNEFFPSGAWGVLFAAVIFVLKS